MTLLFHIMEQMDQNKKEAYPSSCSPVGGIGSEIHCLGRLLVSGEFTKTTFKV